MNSFPLVVDQCLRRLASQSDVFVLQIGAAEGILGDYIHSYLTNSPWDALLLEPISDLFDRLVVNYQNAPRVRCERLAIASHDGTANLYRLDSCDGLPWWAEQLASLDRNVIASHESLIPGLANRIVCEAVPCTTVSTLIERFGIRTVEFAAIDTEGHDAAIILQLLEARLLPDCILFEHKHLAQTELKLLHDRLESDGYFRIDGSDDSLCSRMPLWAS